MLGKIVLFIIKRADAALIEDILEAAWKRKEVLFPEWEIMYLALLKKERKKRVAYLEWMLRTELERVDV